MAEANEQHQIGPAPATTPAGGKDTGKPAVNGLPLPEPVSLSATGNDPRDLDLPHDVRLIATVARLLDLHGSRRERGSRSVAIPAQQIGEAAGYYLWIGLEVIDFLGRSARTGSSGPVSIAHLYEQLQQKIEDLAKQDLEYCVAFLSVEREVHYLNPQTLPRQDGRVTQAPTQLLRYDRRFGQVRLTEAGRLLMRVGSLHQSWMYEDKDVERIPAAIERGMFEDIPRVCEEVIGNLRALNEHLTEIEESPTFESLRAEFLERGRQYRDMMKMANDAIRRAMDLLASPATRERFDTWRSLRGIDVIEVEDALAYVEGVHQALHSLERHFITFLRNIQSRRRAPLGVIRFQDVAERLVYAAPTTQNLMNLFADIGPWRVKAPSFHQQDMVGRADLALDAKATAAMTFEDAPSEEAQRAFQSFLERNHDWIIARLREGPISFSQLAEATGIDFMEGESPATFFGIFMLPEEISGETLRICVGLKAAHRMDVISHGMRLVGDDPVIWLDGDKNDA